MPENRPCALDVDAGVDERGRDALGEVLEGVGYFRAAAGGELEVVDLVDQTTLTRVSTATPQTASMMSVMFARGSERQAEEPGELDREHPRGRGRRDGDVDDRDAVADPGVAVPVDGLDGSCRTG